jgi:tRNA(fMet)-specific endonuclease VapC
MRYLLDTDHISFLQRRSGLEFETLSNRIAKYSLTDFSLSIVSFHEQVLGANNFISRARTNKDLMRGYNLLSETLSGFAAAPVLQFDADAIAIFGQVRTKVNCKFELVA